MQLDTSSKTPQSLASRLGPSLKRSYGEAATARQTETERNSKQPRLGSSSSSSILSAPATGELRPPVFSPDIVMPSWGRGSSSSTSKGSRNHRGKGSGRSGKGSGLRTPVSTLTGLPQFSEPLTDQVYIEATYRPATVPPAWESNPKSALTDFMLLNCNTKPSYRTSEGNLNGERIWRCEKYSSPALYYI